MKKSLNVVVPDLSGPSKACVIECLLSPGDRVKSGDTLLVLEIDKAAVEVPSPSSGCIDKYLVSVGDEVSIGQTVVTIFSDQEFADQHQEKDSFVATQRNISVNLGQDAKDDVFDLLVIGAGPGGYCAAFRAADEGLRVLLVDRRPTLGGVCLNVGCIPSKALLHVARCLEEAKEAESFGVSWGDPSIDLEKLRHWKDDVVEKLSSGLAKMAVARNVTFIQGDAKFCDDNHVIIHKDGATLRYAFKFALIATGSEPVKLPFFPDDPRIWYSTDALSLSTIPNKMLIIGGGGIGLEMATVYSALGSRVSIVESQDNLLNMLDDDLRKVWWSTNQRRFSDVFLQSKVKGASVSSEGVLVNFEGPQGGFSHTYDIVLVCVGRRVSAEHLNLPNLVCDQKGYIVVDDQMRTSYGNIYAIGDIVGEPMLAHKSTHQAHVVSESILGNPVSFDAYQVPFVVYSDPEIAWTGLTEARCRHDGREIELGSFPWASSGRAISQQRTDGMTKLIFDKKTKRIIGAGVVGVHAGDLLGELCLAIEMGAEAVDLARTIHPHPTLCESVGLAAEVALGICADTLPSSRR
ncbi:dihydrolipoyl dehydrogenase [Candidatus Ichthyocystis hellenicum]|uniref:dihydrolipoyl dehydrogenase n=1 Tax=Candidatus Ichthyocystis hellenicum TaxID=1561003 RepID=UPI000AC41B13|nr:dihydrolipoyl dehydrogenase [Candidatus Ichthyocystis hellenicum]